MLLGLKDEQQGSDILSRVFFICEHLSKTFRPKHLFRFYHFLNVHTTQ